MRYIARYHVWKEPLDGAQPDDGEEPRAQDHRRRFARAARWRPPTTCSCSGARARTRCRSRIRRAASSTPASARCPPSCCRYRGWTGKQIENRYSHWIWRQYASAFWDDVRLDRVLPFREARDEEDEKHVHPLQLDVIERVLVLWSNPGETVLTPFMGVGSEVYAAVINGRRGSVLSSSPPTIGRRCAMSKRR